VSLPAHLQRFDRLIDALVDEALREIDRGRLSVGAPEFEKERSMTKRLITGRAMPTKRHTEAAP
jgi:hypothetical protein